MGLSFSVEEDRTIVLAKGRFNLNDVRTTLSQVRARCPLPAATRVVVDDRDCRLAPESADLRRLIALLDELFGRLSARLALVVTSTSAGQEARGRALEDLAAGREFELRVFGSLDEADAWLSS